MDSNLIVKGLSNFVSSQDQFAVMIDGPWGSGKTYFIKNVVIPELREHQNVIYFSVYGYESLNSLKSDLIGNLFISSLGKGMDGSDTRSKVDDAISVAKGALDVFGDKLSSFKSLASVASDLVIKKKLKEQSGAENPAVLVIDDLERISSDIHISDLLGLLLTELIEPYGYRVIIVGNSKEFSKYEFDKFKKIREKIISRIFPFSFNLKNVKAEFFSKSNIEYLKNDSEYLVDILADYAQHNEEHINLRTLEFILNTFSLINADIDEYLENSPKEKSEETNIKRSAFLNLFVIANEYREGRLIREELPSLNRLLYTKNYYFVHVNDNEEKSKAEKIKDRYHGYSNFQKFIMYSNEINDAIFNGVFDAKSFVEKWVELFKPSNKISHLNALAGFRDMTDIQLKKLQEQLLVDSQSETVTVDNIMSTLNNFLYFDENNIYFVDDLYLPKLLGRLRDVAEKEALQKSELFDTDDIYFRFSVIADNSEVMTKVKAIFKSASDAKRKKDTTVLLDAIFSGDDQILNNIRHIGLKTNLFRDVLDSEYLKKDLLVVRTKAPKLDKYLRSEYIRVSNVKDYPKNEASDIEELITKVKEFVTYSDKIGKIDKFNLNELLKTLDKVLNKLK